MLAAGILSLLLAVTIVAPATAAGSDDAGTTTPAGATAAKSASEAVKPASEAAKPAADPTPTPTPTPEPKFRFTGYGTDHGVGFSQRGAAGRAKAGEDYVQILQHYFYKVSIGQVPHDTTIRALIVKSYRAASTQTAILQGAVTRWRIVSTDPALRGKTFRASSRLVLVGRGETGAWHLKVVNKDGSVAATFDDADARVTVEPVPGTSVGSIKVLIRSSATYDTYEGQIRIGRVAGRLRIVNIVPIEPFVRSVTPQELGPANLQDTLKSQAVVARSYFLAGLSTATGFLAYDVESYRASQSYKGTKGEKDATTQAVDATAYQVVAFAGVSPAGTRHVDVSLPSDAGGYAVDPTLSVARTFYHAVGGGATEASQNVFTGKTGKPGSKTPYLRGGPDVDEHGVPYDESASAFSWSSRALTLTQLSAILARSPRTNVGALTKWPIEAESTFRTMRAAALLAGGDPTPDPSNRGVSGRLTWVVLRGTKNGKAVTKKVAGWLFKSVFNTYRGSGDPLGSTIDLSHPGALSARRSPVTLWAGGCATEAPISASDVALAGLLARWPGDRTAGRAPRRAFGPLAGLLARWPGDRTAGRAPRRAFGPLAGLLARWPGDRTAGRAP